MPVYDGDLFTPPAPLAKVTLRNPETRAIVAEVPMLLDTGADVTLLPREFVDQLGLEVNPEEGYELMGFDGNVSVAHVIRLDLLFLRRAFKGQFLLTDRDTGLLGRDVLNHMPLLFDGPSLAWDEQRTSE